MTSHEQEPQAPPTKGNPSIQEDDGLIMEGGHLLDESVAPLHRGSPNYYQPASTPYEHQLRTPELDKEVVEVVNSTPLPYQDELCLE